jgi:phosphoribosylformylglycinamidine synthase subunit PurS
MYRAKIYVTLKKSVMDPQGSTVQHALESLGYEGVQNVRMGKYIELDIAKDDRDKAEEQVDEMCDKLLSNPVIEKYHFDLEELK